MTGLTAVMIATTLFQKPSYQLRCVEKDENFKLIGEPNENLDAVRSLKRSIIATAMNKNLEGTFLIYDQDEKIVN